MALHALINDSDPRSLHLQGTIGDTVLHILIDSNAMLNFIHPKWLPILSLHLDISKHFDIFVSNDNHM